VIRTPGQIANEEIPIAAVCRILGMDMPDLAYMNSPKMYCPFSDLHSDGGASKSFRTYADGNTAHCFACSKTWNVVTLYMDHTDQNYQDAARSLLEYFDIRTEDVDDRWQALIAPQTLTINTAELAEALKLYCARVDPQWEERQFEPAVSATFGACLNLLQSIATVEDVEKWRTATKKVMERVLNA
jgi:hypothetical protein